jgi:hypothetical protein
MNLAFTAVLGFAVGVIVMTILGEPDLHIRPVIPACPAGTTSQQMMPDGRIFCSYIQGRNNARVVWEELK